MRNYLIRKNDGNYRLGFSGDVFDDWFNSPFRADVFGAMKTDILEEEKDYRLDIDVPGFSKEEIKISVENGYLTIEAEKNQEKEEKDQKGNYLRRERNYGSCSRRFYVGDIKKESISASFKDGILTVIVPKATEPEAESKKYIDIE